mmetsp:Transcript_10943/g.23914  ORF Transcript_10943/g.23914 Transcript_10943/m.23914 type:complete len:286 (+) Transcript_10943:375-1232(+)
MAGVSTEELGGHVPRGPAVILLGDVGPLHGLRQPEIADLYIEVQVQHNVHALQVTVDHAGFLAVQVVHCICQLEAHIHAMGQGQLYFPHVQEMVQGASRHVFRDEAQVGELQTSPDKLNKPLVPQMTDGLNLALQVLQDAVNGHHLVLLPIQLLDGHLPPLIRAAEDLAKLPGPQAVQQGQVGVPDLLHRGQRLSQGLLRRLLLHYRGPHRRRRAALRRRPPLGRRPRRARHADRGAGADRGVAPGLGRAGRRGRRGLGHLADQRRRGQRRPPGRLGKSGRLCPG